MGSRLRTSDLGRYNLVVAQAMQRVFCSPGEGETPSGQPARCRRYMVLGSAEVGRPTLPGSVAIAPWPFGNELDQDDAHDEASHVRPERDAAPGVAVVGD